jgi:hypothetical protein
LSVVVDPAPTALVLLTTQGMRARRHPGLVALLWAWETVLALLAAWPAASLVDTAYGNGPAGDGTLWTPGARALLDFLLRNRPGVHAIGEGALAVLLVGAVLGLVPLASTLTVIAFASRDRRPVGFLRALNEGVRLFPAMALLLVAARAVQAITLGFGLVAGSVIEAWVHTGLGEARAQQLQALVLLAFLGLASAVGVGHDLARAAVVRFKVGGGRAILLGTRTLRIGRLSVWWSWAWRAAAALIPILAAAWVTGRLGGRPGGAVFVVFLFHQLVVVARVALHTSWLARAVRIVDSTLKRA